MEIVGTTNQDYTYRIHGEAVWVKIIRWASDQFENELSALVSRVYNTGHVLWTLNIKI